MILGFDHFNITIPDGPEGDALARDFYFTFLGFKEIIKPSEMKNRKGFWGACGDLQLHVSTESFAHRTETRAHFAVRINEMDLFLEKSRLKNVDLKQAETVKGSRRFHLRDPFGNRIELVEVL